MQGQGRLITFEGGEGTGKTTLIGKLAQKLCDDGYRVVTTREPGGTPLGQQFRHWLLGNHGQVSMSARAELLLFLSDRVQHIEEVIKPALKEGKIVLCDRFNDSSVAYQGGARNLGIKEVQTLCSLACEGLKPDLTIYLDLDPVIGLERSRATAKKEASEGEGDRIESEKIQFHHDVRAAMQRLAGEESERIYTLDAAAPIEEVYQRALKIILAKLPKP